MKKLLLAVAILIVIAAMCTPYVMGRIAETQISQKVTALNESPSDNGRHEIVSYDRGLFSTQSTYKYTLPLHYQAVFANNITSIDYSCEFNHRITGVKYQCNIADNEQYTQFITEHFDGKDPISIIGSASILGAIEYTISIDDIDDFSLDQNGSSVSISKTKLNINTTNQFSDYQIAGGSKHFKINANNESLSINDLSVSGDLIKVGQYLYTGNVDAALNRVQLQDSTQNILFNDIQFASSVKQNGENIESLAKVSIAAMDTNNPNKETITDVAFTANAIGVNKQAFIEYQELMATLQKELLTSNTQAPTSVNTLELVPILERLLVKGLSININSSAKLDDKPNSVAIDFALLDSLTFGDSLSFAIAPEVTLNKLDTNFTAKLHKDTVDKDPNLSAAILNSPLFTANNNGYQLDLTIGKQTKLNGQAISLEELQALLISSYAQ